MHPTKASRRLRIRRLLIVSTGTSGIWALDPESGNEVWHRGIPTAGASRVVPVLGSLMFSTTQQGLFLMLPLDGRVIDDGIHTGAKAFPWRRRRTASARSSCLVSTGGHFYSIHVTPPI